MDKMVTENEVAQAVAQSFALANRETTQDNLCYTIKELTAEINGSLKCYCLSAEDVRTALRKGVLGEYGEYFTLSTVTFVKFLKTYVTLRQPTVKQLPYKATITDEELKNRQISGIIQSYEQYCTSGDLQDLGSWKYNFLDKHHLISYTTEEKWQAIRDAAKAAQSTRDTPKNKTLSISDYVAQRYAPNDYITKAKLILLRQFFNLVKDNDFKEEFYNSLKKI